MPIQPEALKDMIGKTITNVIVVHERPSYPSPHENMFIVFDDGSYIEIYGDHLCSGSCAYPGGYAGALSYAQKMGVLSQLMPE